MANEEKEKNEINITNKDNPVTKEYRTEDLIVYWTPSLCSHAGKCTHGLPEVFNPDRKPWINLEAARPEEIIKAIDQCPTKALQYKLTEHSKVDPDMAKGPCSVDYKPDKNANVQIKVVNNGPFIVKGPIRLVDSKGQLIKEDNQMVLCRCCLSKNQPFCDGSHRKEE